MAAAMSDEERFEHINNLFHEELFEEALILCDELLESCVDPIICANTLRRVGDCKHQLGRSKEALTYFTQALKIPTGDDFTTCMIYLSKALVLQSLRRYAQAQKAFQKAVEFAGDDEDLEQIKAYWEGLLFEIESSTDQDEFEQEKSKVLATFQQAFEQIVGKKPDAALLGSEWSKRPVLRA